MIWHQRPSFQQHFHIWSIEDCLQALPGLEQLSCEILPAPYFHAWEPGYLKSTSSTRRGLAAWPGHCRVKNICHFGGCHPPLSMTTKNKPEQNQVFESQPVLCSILPPNRCLPSRSGRGSEAGHDARVPHVPAPGGGQLQGAG